MHKFDRNIGLYELTFIDHEAPRAVTSTILLHMEKAGEYLDSRQCRKSKERPSERGNEPRRRRGAGGTGGGGIGETRNE